MIFRFCRFWILDFVDRRSTIDDWAIKDPRTRLGSIVAVGAQSYGVVACAARRGSWIGRTVCHERSPYVVSHYLVQRPTPRLRCEIEACENRARRVFRLGTGHRAAEGGAGSGGKPDVRRREKASRCKLLCGQARGEMMNPPAYPPCFLKDKCKEQDTHACPPRQRNIVGRQTSSVTGRRSGAFKTEWNSCCGGSA